AAAGGIRVGLGEGAAGRACGQAHRRDVKGADLGEKGTVGEADLWLLARWAQERGVEQQVDEDHQHQQDQLGAPREPRPWRPGTRAVGVRSASRGVAATWVFHCRPPCEWTAAAVPLL